MYKLFLMLWLPTVFLSFESPRGAVRGIYQRRNSWTVYGVSCMPDTSSLHSLRYCAISFCPDSRTRSPSWKGPEYVSLTAGEAEMPRRTMPRAFRGVFHRLTVFFIFGSLCVGVVVPYSDPNLLRAISSAKAGAGSSPYVIAMERMNIRVLPHIVNALIMTSIFSAGNSYFFCATRTLYGLALEGKMPRPLLACTRTGIPIICAGLTFGISCLGSSSTAPWWTNRHDLRFLQASYRYPMAHRLFSNGPSAWRKPSQALTWVHRLTHLLTASHLMNYAIISFTYIRFYKVSNATLSCSAVQNLLQALKFQAISRDSLPCKTFWQPFCGYYALFGTSIMAFVAGYTVFLPGYWNTLTFVFSYAMIAIVPLLLVFWKIYHRTQVSQSRAHTIMPAQWSRFFFEVAKIERYHILWFREARGWRTGAADVWFALSCPIEFITLAWLGYSSFLCIFRAI